MMTVRFPSGVAMTYNDACFLQHGDGEWKIYDKDPAKGGRAIAFVQASAGVVCEWNRPCKIEAPPVVTGRAAIQWLLENVRRLDSTELGLLRDLKKALRAFNIRTRCWKAS